MALPNPSRSPTRLPVRSAPTAVNGKTHDETKRPTTLHRRGVSSVTAGSTKLQPTSVGAERDAAQRARGRTGTVSSVVSSASSSKTLAGTGAALINSKRGSQDLSIKRASQDLGTKRASQDLSTKRASQDLDKKAIPPPTRLTRTASVRAPARHSTSDPTKEANLRSHARNQSVAVGSGLSRMTSVSKRSEPSRSHTPSDTQSRPPSVMSIVSTTSIATTATATSRPTTRSTTAGHSRLPSHASGLQRAATTSTRPSRAASTVSSSTSTTASRVPALNTNEPPQLARPNFSTLQQHYSPKRTTAPKPPVPTGKSLLSESTAAHSRDIPADIISLQTHLLQLHLLHSSSHQVQKQWESSAQSKLLRRFHDTAEAHKTLREQEREIQEKVNLVALEGWDTGVGLAEKVAVLSNLLAELPALVEAEGRYSRLVEGFERWLGWVESIRETRSGPMPQTPRSKGRRDRMEFVERIGDAWLAEHAALSRKVTGLMRQSQNLDIPASANGEATTTKSSLYIVVKGCLDLLRGMKEELEVMRRIEREVGEREGEWVDNELGAIEGDLKGVLEGHEEDGPVWGRRGSVDSTESEL